MSVNLKKRKITNLILAAAIILFWLAFTAVFFVNCAEKQVYPILYKEEIIAVSERYGIDSALVFAIVRTESGFDPFTVSAKGAAGLMQILPSTGEYIAAKRGIAEYDLFDVNTNLDFGCYYWKYLSEKFYGLNETAAAYNAGEGTVGGWLKNREYSADGKRLGYIPYRETREYVEKIYESLKRYRKLYAKLLDKP